MEDPLSLLKKRACWWSLLRIALFFRVIVVDNESKFLGPIQTDNEGVVLRP